MAETKRPYFNSSIIDLENIVRQHPYDKNRLEEIKHELSFRKVKRAKALKLKVNRLLVALTKNTTKQYPIQKPSIQQESSTPPEIISSPSEPNSNKHPFHIYDPSKRPKVDNNAVSILSTWTALEVLSPQTFKKPEDLIGGNKWDVIDITKQQLPWIEQKEKAKPNTRLYYYIVLGQINMASTIDTLMKVFGDTRPEYSAVKDNAVLAVITVDKFGRPIEDNSVAISSFGWGFSQIRQGNMAYIGDWEKIEKKLLEKLSEKLLITDDNGEIKPLNNQTILSAYKWLTNKLGLYSSEVEPPKYILKKYQWIVLKNPPDPLLLNSFYLSDLSKAKSIIQSNSGGKALKAYLGLESPNSTIDILQETDQLEKLLSPRNIPQSRWTMKGCHSLVLLQQAAVNLAFKELEHEGILGVNGPPGTGKTTLLCDHIAGILLNRAKEMVSLSDPEEAFSHKGKTKFGNAFVHLYSIDSNIRGHEILVASSNNKAVENISQELPSINAIDSSVLSDGYFRTTSDAISGEENSTWGLIAAVLGNASNRNAFRKKFWSDNEVGLKDYLKVASGTPVIIEEEDKVTGEIKEREPLIVQKESPPTGKNDALSRWKLAQGKFNASIEKIENILNLLTVARDSYKNINNLEAQLHTKNNNFDKYSIEYSNYKCEHEKLISLYIKQENILGKIRSEIATLIENKPGFITRIFKTKTWVLWKSSHNNLILKEKKETESFNKTRKYIDSLSIKLDKLKDYINQIIKERDILLSSIKTNEKSIRSASDLVGNHFVNATFLAQNRKELHQAIPWLGKEVQRTRDNVFEASIELHRAFIDCAAKPIRHNLMALMQIFIGRKLRKDLQDLIPELWSTLFLVTPVISTTFASVNRMLGILPPEHIGWLLIDEAGQAIPQAAIGAILRSKRVIAVGDPLQIEPVVTLPNKLVEEICFHHGVDPELYSAPKCSTQSLADAASQYGTELERDVGSIWIGAPLLVHRRCENPMFQISNAVAYNHLMVSAVAEKHSQIRQIIGTSQWFNIEGTANDKWSPQEGELVLSLLNKLVINGINQPDIYIITPFRVVAQRMRDLLRRNHSDFLDHTGLDTWEWLSEHVGTVHTFQGKEAEAVIFLLGASDPKQNGARSWAGGQANLINVAVSRAKQVIYIVGNRKLWSTHGFFNNLSRRLPKKQL